MNEATRKIIESINSKRKTNSNGESGTYIEELTTEEKVTLLILSNGYVNGIGEVNQLSISLDPLKYPKNILDHFCDLSDNGRYSLIQNLAKEFKEIDNSIRSGKFKTWSEGCLPNYSSNDPDLFEKVSKGEPCGHNCQCY